MKKVEKNRKQDINMIYEGKEKSTAV